MMIETDDPKIILENAFCEMIRHIQDVIENRSVLPAEITLPVVEGNSENLQMTLQMQWSPKVVTIAEKLGEK